MVNYEQTLKVSPFGGLPKDITWAVSALYVLDTAGFSRMTIDVIHQPPTTVTNTARYNVLKLYHGEETVISAMTAIQGWQGTTNTTAAAGEFVIPAAATNTTDSVAIRFQSEIAPFARYIGVAIAPPIITGSKVGLATVAYLGGGPNPLGDATAQGVAAYLPLPQ